jgi:hypothetical protein
MNNNSVPNILFIGKKDDYFSKVAAGYLKENIPLALIIYSSRSEPIPDLVKDWKGDYIISYPSRCLTIVKYFGKSCFQSIRN